MRDLLGIVTCWPAAPDPVVDERAPFGLAQLVGALGEPLHPPGSRASPGHDGISRVWRGIRLPIPETTWNAVFSSSP